MKSTSCSSSGVVTKSSPVEGAGAPDSSVMSDGTKEGEEVLLEDDAEHDEEEERSAADAPAAHHSAAGLGPPVLEVGASSPARPPHGVLLREKLLS